MAKIITTKNAKRRTIRLSTDDIISVVQSYQQLTKRCVDIGNIRDILSNTVFYLPEEM
jgi:hypothetical protein